MAQAFSNYHNAAMPAIVGTSKLLAALNLPLDSRAKQIAARLVLCPCRECSKGNQMELRRTQAAEETVRQVKKTNQLLKDMGGGDTMTFS